MVDERIKKLANILVNWSITIKKGSVIDLSFGPEAKPLAMECYKLILKKGAFPRLSIGLPDFAYAYYKNASTEQLKRFPKIAMHEVKNTQGSIHIGTPNNTKELTNIDSKKLVIRRKVTHPISKFILKQNNWVICEYPTHALAQDAEMSLEEFEDFAYDAMLIDYPKLSKSEDKLKKIVDKGKQVRIVGKDTDITFSIKGRLGAKCAGERNIPGGEVFTAPVDKSAEGYIAYSYPAIHGGKEVSGIKLWFKKGKVVKATAEKNEDYLHTMLKTDKGASYLGEFGIGLNYGIKNFVKQILFDEKIGGTIHLALGSAYKECRGTNESALHWDMILDLRKGGKFMIDGKVIQKNGKFLI
jgi:aminopeptidase